MLGGPYLKVDIHTGAIVEGMLTFMSSILVLYIILRGPKSWLLKNWLLSASIVILAAFGRSYTGPSLNPANVSFTNSLFPFFFFFKKKVIIISNNQFHKKNIWDIVSLFCYEIRVVLTFKKN